MSASLENQFISDKYTSLLHLSGAQLTSTLDTVYDGLGNDTGIQVSTEKVVVRDLNISVDTFFPINSIQLTTDNVNPGSRIEGTTWELVSEGRFLAGVGTGTDQNNITRGFTAENGSVGEYEHTLKASELPSHSHSLTQSNGEQTVFTGGKVVQEAGGKDNPSYSFDARKGGIPQELRETGSIGGSESHNNTPPYFGVYIWKRTA